MRGETVSPNPVAVVFSLDACALTFTRCYVVSLAQNVSSCISTVDNHVHTRPLHPFVMRPGTRLQKAIHVTAHHAAVIRYNVSRIMHFIRYSVSRIMHFQ